MSVARVNWLGALGLMLCACGARGQVDLLQRYPTPLTAGDNSPGGQPWEFTPDDIYRVTEFHFQIAKQLRVDTGPADVGIGHAADGAVWAAVIPRREGTLFSPSMEKPETIAHVWLRFHPKEIGRLFPPPTVFPDGARALAAQMSAIASVKMNGSWQSSGHALIPGPKDMTVDVDTTPGKRRFFVVDTQAQTAEYAADFANDAVPQLPMLSPKLAEDAFDQLWNAFDRDYAMFVLRPEVDWARLREQYRPKALASQSTYEFVGVCAELLRPLRDLHVWLSVAGVDVPVYNRKRVANFNLEGCKAILHQAALEGGEKREVAWAVTTNHIGYIAVFGWKDARISGLCHEALEHMRDTRGLIIDVRFNGGGSEPVAKEFAERFLDREFTYALSQYRDGPLHTDLTAKSARTATPRGPWRYDRPVILLIGQKCMSSTESFVSMMTGDPLVTTMGDHTCGSSGNPEIVSLPLEVTVSVPRWIDYLPDGTPLDERGVRPQVPFRPGPGAFTGTRDDLLAGALARLRDVPRPVKAIEGPAFEGTAEAVPDFSQAIKAEAADASLPKVVSVSPTNAVAVGRDATAIRIRFDRPMNPHALKLDWAAGGYLDCDYPRYDSNHYEFTVPVHLAPASMQEIVVNQPEFGGERLSETRKEFPRDGFQSADHHLAALFAWRFRTLPLEEVAGALPPQSVGVVPKSGGQVPCLTILEIRFDQPMLPPEEARPELLADGEEPKPEMISSIEYDAATHAFRIPLLLQPATNVAFTLAGFRAATGVLAAPIQLQYQVSDQALTTQSQDERKARSRDPRLLRDLSAMKERRQRLTSLAERVETLKQFQKAGLFYELQLQSATFEWQKPGQYYGDVSDVMSMCTDYRLASDGRQWWLHGANSDSTNLAACPVANLQEANISLCDPFDLTHLTPAAAATALDLNEAGDATLDGAACFRAEAWEITRHRRGASFGVLHQWWIDSANDRCAQIITFGPEMVDRSRFIYDTVNEPLPPSDFAMPPVPGLSPSAPERLDTNYNRRFINLRDGSDGQMSVRWGKKGPMGTSSSGLN